MENLSTNYKWSWEVFTNMYWCSRRPWNAQEKNTKGNNLLFMNKSLTCAHLKTSQLRNKYLKVAREINLKLTFTDRFFKNLIILIKLCKIRYLNLDKTLLFPRNQVICLRNWKLWRAPSSIKFNIFFAEILHTSPT